MGTQQKRFSGHNAQAQALAISPDGRKAISAAEDNTLKVWDLATGEIIASFSSDGSIHCCAVAPDGVTIVAGESSGRLHFLRLEVN